MKSAIAAVFAFLGCVVLATPGCKLLERRVNRLFPPVTELDQRETAIKGAAAQLEKLSSPSIAAGVSLHEISPTLAAQPALRNLGIKGLLLEGKQQLLYARVEIDRDFGETDLPQVDAETAKLLRRLRPRVRATLTFALGLAVAPPSGDGNGSKIALKLLPVFQKLEVKELRVAKDVDVGIAAKLVARLLNRFKDNVTGALARARFVDIDVPVALKPQKLESVFTGPQMTVTARSPALTSPFNYDGAAWLISDNRLTVLLQLKSTGDATAAAVSPVEPEFAKVRERFELELEESFGEKLLPTSSTTWVAIRKDTIAGAVNHLARQTNVCARASLDSTFQDKGTVPIPDGSDISCASDKDCSQTSRCEWEQHRRDNRDCMRCFGKRMGKKCLGVKTNDPVCVAAREAQNALYIAQANAAKAACDAGVAAEVAACQAGENGKRLACEAGKATLKRLSQTGDLGRLNVSARLTSDGLSACVENLAITPDLSAADATFTVSGKLKADIDIKFEPRDFGHAACVFSWDKLQAFEVELHRPSVSAAAKTVFKRSALEVTFAVDPLKVRVEPSPTNVLLQSSEVILKCPLVAALTPLVLIATPFVPELNGKFEFEPKPMSFSIPISLPKLKVGQRVLAVQLKTLKKALLVTGDLK